MKHLNLSLDITRMAYKSDQLQSKALSLSQRDRNSIWHPFTPQKYMPDPIPIVKAEGLYLIDENGNRYMDAISSWWVNLHGHAHPYIAKKIYEQALKLEQVIFAGFTHEPAIELAERLLNILPKGFSKIFYSDNGSTSTEVAIKMALQWWWNEAGGSRESRVVNEESEIRRNKILALRNSYHGDTFGAMSVSERSVFTLAFQDKLFEVIFIDPPESSEQDYDLPFDEIACFIYEPLVQGAGGMNMYSAEGLNALLKTCHQHDIICIADEVMTGFGRTGKLFASDYCHEKPDIICLSKGLTGGTMALGVTACNELIYSAFLTEDKRKTFFHGHSFTANPLACTAALASLELFEIENCTPDLVGGQIETISEMNLEFLERLKAIINKIGIRNARCLGTIVAFELESADKDYLNNISTIITEKALAKGIYIRPLGNTIYLMPPYCIQKEELERLYKVILEIIQ